MPEEAIAALWGVKGSGHAFLKALGLHPRPARRYQCPQLPKAPGYSFGSKVVPVGFGNPGFEEPMVPSVTGSRWPCAPLSLASNTLIISLQGVR